MACKYNIDGKELTKEQFISYVKSLNKEELSSIIPINNIKDKKLFTSSHFPDNPNILVHLRMNERVDANGDKVLFLEEVQSDWGQKGKKEGFAGKKAKDVKNVTISETPETIFDEGTSRQKNNYVVFADGVRIGLVHGTNKEDALLNAKKRISENPDATIIPDKGKGAPSAPFVTDTNSWVKLGLKTALQKAVEAGAKKLAWTTGTQQFERWGTEKIDWVSKGKRTESETKRMNELGDKIVSMKETPSERAEYTRLVEKEGWTINIQEQFRGTAFEGINVDEKALSEKGITITSKEDLKAAIDRNLSREKNESERQKLTDRIWDRMQKEDSGTSLPRKEGMESFYGVGNNIGIIGKQAEALVKELTGQSVKVGETKIEIGEEKLTKPENIGIERVGQRWQLNFAEKPTFDTYEQAEKAREELSSKQSTQHSIEITPELASEVQAGMPLFQQANAQYRIKNGKNLIEALKDFDGSPQAVTAITHEIMHPTVVAIIDGAKEGNAVGKKHTKTIVDEYNKANPNNKVTEQELIADNDKFKNGTTTDKYRAVQEFIAEAFEQYHTEGASGFSKAFQEVLDVIRDAFRAVYQTLTNKQLTPELRQMFDEILGKEVEQSNKESKSGSVSEKTDLQKAEDNLRNAWRNFLNNGVAFDGMAEAEKEIQLIIALLGYLKAKGIDIAKGISDEIKGLIKNKFQGATDEMINVAQGRMLTDYQKLYDTQMTEKNKQVLDDMVNKLKSGDLSFEQFAETLNNIVPNERIKNVFFSYVNEQLDPLENYVKEEPIVEEEELITPAQSTKEEDRVFIGRLLARPINKENFPNIVGGGKTDEDVLKRITAITQEDVQDRKVMVDTSYVRVALDDIKEIALQNANAFYMQFGEDWQNKVMDYLSDYLNAANPAQAIGILNVISTDVQQKIQKSKSPSERESLFKLQDKADELSILFASQASLGINARKILRQFAQGSNMSKLVLDKILTEDTIQTIEEINKIMSVPPSSEELNNATMPIVEPQTAKSRLQKIKENIKQAVSSKSKKRGKISESEINNLGRKAEEERKRQGVQTKMSREQILEMLKEESKKC